ncbi:hypothetical protein P8818_16670 [Bacillus velezensis]|jgi:flagellar motor component MotA|uniref:hypothetical protein n=1 Tax=Bacillus subtilis group TaxID=653685 RepID=UPI001EE9E69E|nr:MULTISPECIES: hypothetical protein [Bacillus subtilis group]MCT6515538.1 hypothetical protein [Bacillus subtilis]MEC0383800.1 hypothetical protein [Bacillus velezensis]MEC0389187.1 hypothetical protein [Bacillus velezensis]WBY48006.1 hypothetical protein PF996_21520 [Bacillus velezensis]
MDEQTKELMKERINELKSELKQSVEEKEVVQSFINKQEGNIPTVVNDTLRRQIRKLTSNIKSIEASLKHYE